MARMMLYEAAQSMRIARHGGIEKAIVALARL